LLEAIALFCIDVLAKMNVFRRESWLNFLVLLPSTVLTILVISIAFLRFYDERDFQLLGYVAYPRVWSNRFTVAALMAALVNFGVEWNRRNRETDRQVEEEQRRVEEEQRRVEEEQRRVEEREQAARRARIETRCRIAQIRCQLDPNERYRQELMRVLAVLEAYSLG
jgi:hypothetical protein